MYSCKGKSTKTQVLPLDTMKVVIWDLMNAEEWNNLAIVKDTALRKSKNNLKLYQQVFFIHHLSKEQFYYSYQYYEQQPDKMKILVDTLSAFAERQKDKSLRMPTSPLPVKQKLKL
jgi:hypothetical protein